jgi:hypothetical protein
LRIVPLLIAVCLVGLPAHAKYGGGSGTADDPYRIDTAADLIALGESPDDYDKHFVLTADIDLDPNLPGRKVFDKAIIAPDTDPGDRDAYGPAFSGPAFTGILDGNGHTISHLTIKGRDYVGLFGKLAPRAEVKDLGVADVSIVGSGYSIGGLVGYKDNASLTRCYSTGTVGGTGEGVGGLVGCNTGAVTWCYSTGAVNGKYYVGGLVGSNYPGFVANCYSSAAVSGIDCVGGLVGYNWGFLTQCYSTGTVSGDRYVGGLVGSNDNPGYVRQSYSTGAVAGTGGFVGGLMGYNSGFVTQSYSMGAVGGGSPVGGFVGGSYDGRVTASFWDIQTSGQAISAGGTGKTTAEMQDPNTFITAGWDFSPHDIWFEPEGGGYPVLWWQLSTIRAPDIPSAVLKITYHRFGLMATLRRAKQVTQVRLRQVILIHHGKG